MRNLDNCIHIYLKYGGDSIVVPMGGTIGLVVYYSGYLVSYILDFMFTPG